MKSSPACHALIKSFEGFATKAYLDVAGVWTIGYGTTGGVKPTDVIDEPAATARLVSECTTIGTALSAAIKVPVTQNQFDACVSFSYNLGIGAFKGSTLLKKINAKDFAGAAAEFPKWVNAGKPPKPLAGLARRRKAERDLFLQSA